MNKGKTYCGKTIKDDQSWYPGVTSFRWCKEQ